jgi:hypothetical protein
MFLNLLQPAGEPNAYANVYANISIDYSKLHVTPNIMLDVLAGNAAGAELISANTSSAYPCLLCLNHCP